MLYLQCSKSSDHIATGVSLEQRPIPARQHVPRLDRAAPYLGQKIVRSRPPIRPHARLTEQGFRDFPIGGPRTQPIGDAKGFETAGQASRRRKLTGIEPPFAPQPGQPPQCLQPRLETLKAGQAIVEPHPCRVTDGTFHHIEPQAPPAVRQGDILTTVVVACHGRHHLQPSQVDGIRIARLRGRCPNRDDSRVEARTPEQSRVERRPARIFGESAGPRARQPGPPLDLGRAPRHRSARSR